MGAVLPPISGNYTKIVDMIWRLDDTRRYAKMFQLNWQDIGWHTEPSRSIIESIGMHNIFICAMSSRACDGNLYITQRFVVLLGASI